MPNTLNNLGLPKLQSIVTYFFCRQTNDLGLTTQLCDLRDQVFQRTLVPFCFIAVDIIFLNAYIN